MESKKIYETETSIFSFAGSGNMCFCDDHKYPIRLFHITYPSVRHAVLSWKTDDLDIRKRIPKLLPSDLKKLENSIRETSNLWKLGFIKQFFENYTFKKFYDVPEFGRKLLNTGDKNLIGGLMPGEANLSINELRIIKNYEGLILMKVRSSLRKQKAP